MNQDARPTRADVQTRTSATGRPPAAIGRYKVLRVLGEGGMGVVYGAEDARLGRPVALKVMRAEHSEAADRLAREARTAAGIAITRSSRPQFRPRARLSRC